MAPRADSASTSAGMMDRLAMLNSHSNGSLPMRWASVLRGVGAITRSPRPSAQPAISGFSVTTPMTVLPRASNASAHCTKRVPLPMRTLRKGFCACIFVSDITTPTPPLSAATC